MSPTLSDDLLVRDLHERTDRVLPAMSLEPADVLVAGRQRRRRKAALRSGAGLAAVGLVVAGVTIGPLAWENLTSADRQDARPLGDGQVFEAAPGVLAANRPVERTLDDGTVVLELGIEVGGMARVGGPWVDDLPVAATAVEPETLAMWNEIQAQSGFTLFDEGVALRGIWESQVSETDRMSLMWPSADAPSDYPRGYPNAQNMDLPWLDATLYLGAVPSWLPDPHVVLFSSSGFALADGTRTSYLEIPTFRGPTEDGRLLYVATVANGGLAGDPAVDRPVDVFLFVGSDGQVVPMGCDFDGSWETCAARYGPELYDAIGMEPPTPAVPELDALPLPDGVVQVAPGIRAATAPVERELRNDLTALMLGLVGGEIDGARELGVVPNDGALPDAEFAYWASKDAGLDLALITGDQLASRTHWGLWASGEWFGTAPLTDAEREWWGHDGWLPEPFTPELIRGAPDAETLAPNEGWASAKALGDGTWLVVGLAPLGADPAALAEVTLREPVTGTDGEPTSVLRVPTFDAPTADGRRMFALTIEPGVGIPTTDATYPLERIPVPLVPSD